MGRLPVQQPCHDTSGETEAKRKFVNLTSDSNLMHFSDLTLHCEDLRNHSVGSLMREQRLPALNHFNSPLECDTGILLAEHGVVVCRADKLQ